MKHYKRHNCHSKCHIVQQTKLENPVVTKLIALELRIKAIIKPVQPVVKKCMPKRHKCRIGKLPQIHKELVCQ